MSAIDPLRPAGDPIVARKLRRSGLFLLAGLLVETATLLALDRPLGFLAFAILGGTLIVFGIALYLWAIVSQAGVPPDPHTTR